MKKQSIKFISGIVAAFVTAIPSVGWADVVPSALFTDHMVIQRETQAPVWGTADAGESVTVSGAGVKPRRPPPMHPEHGA